MTLQHLCDSEKQKKKKQIKKELKKQNKKNHKVVAKYIILDDALWQSARSVTTNVARTYRVTLKEVWKLFFMQLSHTRQNIKNHEILF